MTRWLLTSLRRRVPSSESVKSNSSLKRVRDQSALVTKYLRAPNGHRRTYIRVSTRVNIATRWQRFRGRRHFRDGPRYFFGA